MSVATLEIQTPGMHTTVQDLGRTGFQRFGVPVAGAADPTALRVANILVGNREGAAALEVTAIGPKATFLSDTVIAITGADLGALIDGQPVPRWRSVPVASGSTLEFTGPSDGMRAYLALTGGIAVPVVMGSRSTYVLGGIGGLEGRPLVSGDVLKSLLIANASGFRAEEMPEDIEPPVYGNEHELRVVLGPQKDAFTDVGVSTFLSSQYTVTADSDRMGCRLEGPVIEPPSEGLLSEGICLGAVQVPPDGQPIVLMNDRQTIGGYPKMGSVLSVDLWKLGQCRTGSQLRFETLAQETAVEVLRTAIEAREAVELKESR